MSHTWVRVIRVGGSTWYCSASTRLTSTGGSSTDVLRGSFQAASNSATAPATVGSVAWGDPGVLMTPPVRDASYILAWERIRSRCGTKSRNRSFRADREEQPASL